MKKVLQNAITIVVEISVFILSIIWYRNSNEIEPLIAIITSSSFLTTSIISFYWKDKIIKARPKLYFHHLQDFSSRSPNGYSTKNPSIIRLGIDTPIQYWELEWSYNLEIRNNSSIVAYNIDIEYKDKPTSAKVRGEIGKIQPIKNNESIQFNFRISKFFEGTHLEADEMLKNEDKLILQKLIIIAQYKDEYDTQYLTEYNWVEDINIFK